MDDSMYNDWRNHRLFADNEDSIIKLSRSKQDCCDHDFRKRKVTKGGWSHVCVECGLKSRF